MSRLHNIKSVIWIVAIVMLVCSNADARRRTIHTRPPLHGLSDRATSILVGGGLSNVLNGLQSGGTGVSGYLSLTHRIENQQVSFRILTHHEIALFGGPTLAAGDLGILYGLSMRSSSFTGSLSAGIGLAVLSYRDENESTLSLPLEGRMMWPVSSSIGLGVCVAASVNSQSSRLACVLALQIGKVR